MLWDIISLFYLQGSRYILLSPVLNTFVLVSILIVSLVVFLPVFVIFYPKLLYT